MATVTETWLSPKEAAAFLGLAEQTLAKWRMTAAHLPFARAGVAIRYKLSDLQAYMERRTVPASA